MSALVWPWFGGHILKPGGKLVIAHFDWLPLTGNVVEATEELILQYNPSRTKHQ
jgi:hypothetical protein